jgi:hypothetical protein
MSGAQRTLTGEEADGDRSVPSTMLHCDECGARVLRSRRDEHPHELDEADDVTTAREKKLRDKVPSEARVETAEYNVTFHYEMVEQVSVEAADKQEAKRRAQRKQTYDGEIMETLHTERRQWGEYTPASIEYLEQYNLLPDDHDVTEDDLVQVMNLD